MPDTPEPPVPLERGRYAVYVAPDGGWVVARALDVCEDCQAHGCGTQADPIMIPAMIIKMASMRDAGMMRKLRAMMAGGRAVMDGADGLEELDATEPT